jgi:hypothetical protein
LAWCPDCCAEVDAITLTSDSISQPATAAQVEGWLGTSNLHLWYSAEGAVQICVTSLLRCTAQEEAEGRGFSLFQTQKSHCLRRKGQ